MERLYKVQMVETLKKLRSSRVQFPHITPHYIFQKGGFNMPEKRTTLVTVFRVLTIIALLIVFFRNESVEVIFSAIMVLSVAIWLIPNLLAALSMTIFNIKENYLGTLLYDDTDITDCKFRMIFDLDPEYMMHNQEILVKIEKANLHDREQNND